MDHQQKNYKTERARGLGRKNKRGDRKGESNDSPEIPDRRKTSDIPGFPSALGILEELWLAKIRGEKNPEVPTWWSPQPVLEDLALGAEMGLMISSTHDSTDPATSQSQDPLGHVHCTSKSCMHRTGIGVNNFHLHFNILCSLVHQLNTPQHSQFSGALAYYTTFSVLLYISLHHNIVFLYTSLIHHNIPHFLVHWLAPQFLCSLVHQLTPQHSQFSFTLAQFVLFYTSLHHIFFSGTLAYTTPFPGTLQLTPQHSLFYCPLAYTTTFFQVHQLTLQLSLVHYSLHHSILCFTVHQLTSQHFLSTKQTLRPVSLLIS